MSNPQNIYLLKGDTNEDIITEIDLSNNLINATKMCQSAGKFWYTYYKSQRTQNFLKTLCNIMNCDQKQIIYSKKGGLNQATWVHPTIATNLAAWCSDEFGVKVSIWIEKAKKEILPIKNEWNISIENIKPSHSTQVERIVRDNLSRALNGRIEVESTHGFIDIVTNNEIIEVKYADNYKSAIGQILSYSQDFPSLKKRIHLYHSEIDKLSKYFTKAKSVCDKYDINITCEIFNDIENGEIITSNIEDKEDDSIEYERELERERERERELEREREKTRQLELQLELAEKNKEELASLNRVEEIQDEYNGEHPIKIFISKNCEFGGDTINDKYRIVCTDLYKEYMENHNITPNLYPFIAERAFNKYITDNLKLKYKACNWSYHTYMTWFNIRLKKKPVELIQRIITDFINSKCMLGKDYFEDTKLLYDAFEEYALDKGFDAIKQNGFTRQNFRTQLRKNRNDITVKNWAINGKTHAFMGIKLASTVSLDNVVKVFVEEQCLKGFGHRAKNIDLMDAFNEFIKNRYILNFKRIAFYNTLKEQNPDLIEQHVTQSQMGFIGISVKNTE
jgi:hypothetical protein